MDPIESIAGGLGRGTAVRRSFFRRVSLAIFISAVLATALFGQNQGDAQAATVHSFGCSNTEEAESTFSAELRHPSKVGIARVVDADEIRRALTGGRHVLYSKIDVAKFGISRVDFYVHLRVPKEDEPLSKNSRLTIYIKVSRASDVAWFKLVEPEPEGPAAEPLLIGLGTSNDDSSPVIILPAANDRTIPMFDVWWDTDLSGVWGDNRETHVLLDFRAANPVVAADLQCHAITAFGVCGVWDAQQSGRTNYECDWKPDRNDFACVRADGALQSYFELMSSKEIPVDVEPGSPRTLREFLDLAERDAAWRNRQVDLPGLGATAHLLRLVLRDGSIAHVFGAAGERFFFGLLIKGKPPQVEPIPWAAIFDARDDDEKAEAPKEQQSASAAHYKSVNFAQSVRVISNGFTSNVKPLFQKPETHIYQITSREDQKHSLYWLAIDDEQKDNTVLFELAQIATEDEPYTSCGSSRTIGSAAKITVERGATFHAVLEVEPSHILDVEESAQPRDSNADPEDWCPSTLRLEWKNHSEWTPTDQKTHCLTPFSPRKISISDDGTITPTPIQVAKPDP